MNMMFFLQFLHIVDPNLPTTPSVNWKFAVVSWLLGSHLHLKYGTSHAEKKKTWLSSQCCTNQRQKAWLYPQESDKRWAKEMCTTCEIQGSRTWLHPFKAMEQRPAPNQARQATCVHTERSDRIVSSSCIVLARSQIRLCPVVNFGDQQTYQRDTVAARNRHECKEEKSTAQDTSCSSGCRRMTVLGASLGGSGKLGGEKVVARLSKDAIAGIQQLCSDGLGHELRPILEPFKVAVPLFFSRWNRWTKIVFNLTQIQRTLFLAQRPRNRDAGQICQGKVFRRLSRWSGKWCFELLATAVQPHK